MTDDKLRAALDALDRVGFALHGTHNPTGSWMLCDDHFCRLARAALAASATDEGETEPCPTCMQPVPVPQRGDHDYGIPLAARPAVPALDAMTLGRAMDFVDREDEALGVVGRGRKVDRIIAAYAALLEANR